MENDIHTRITLIFLPLSCSPFSSGIVSDLFPGLVEKEVDYEILEAGIRKSIGQIGLQDVNGEFYFSHIIRTILRFLAVGLYVCVLKLSIILFLYIL